MNQDKQRFKKWAKRVLIGIASVFVLLVAILAIHIYQVTRIDKKQDKRPRALSIINLTNPADSTDIGSVYTATTELKGINTVKVSPNRASLICEWNTTQTSPDEIVSSLNKKGFVVEKFEVPANLKGGGCPVIDNTSITYRMGKFFQSIFE